MSSVIVIARLVLIAVFAAAGLTKLRDLPGTRKSLGDFGVPERLQSIGGWLLPLAELGCVIALALTRTAQWGAVAAIGLLAIFIAAVTFNLARGRRPDCHCFGQLSSGPIGWSTIARNLVLATLAALVVVRGPGFTASEVVAAIAGSSYTLLALAVVGIIVGVAGVWAIVHLLRLNGKLLMRLEDAEARLGIQIDPDKPGLSIGVVAPKFSLRMLDDTDDDEAPQPRAQLDRKNPILLVFISDHCGACDEALPEIGTWQREYEDKLSVIVVARGQEETTRAKIFPYRLRHVFLQEKGEIELAYKTAGTPAAVLLKDGLIASHAVTSLHEIQKLVESVVLPPPLNMGDRVPSIRLKDLEGRSFDLATLRGRRTLLVFWSPTCSFCLGMADDLKAWERDRPRGTPELVFIAAGSAEANRAIGFRSRMLLDPTFAVSQVFGSAGTPSAIVIDADGRVASVLRVGAKEIFVLAGRTTEGRVAEAVI